MVKLIRHTGECNHADDSSLPYKLELVMRPPEFMAVVWAFMHGGTEEVAARGSTVGALRDWMRERGLDAHPRLSRWAITDHNGLVVARGCLDGLPRRAVLEFDEDTDEPDSFYVMLDDAIIGSGHTEAAALSAARAFRATWANKESP
jgi:hypothetical protein